jgi:sterol desaturase/sphingolipid hydroxylase (fatty acid hydroxylase superfamily)
MLVNPFVGLPVIVAFGLSPWVLALYELLDVAVTLFSHSNLHVPGWIDRWLRYIVVTPDLHRIHHSVHPEETNRNFGAVFPFWDMVLGTFLGQPRDGHEAMRLGLQAWRGADAQRLGALLLSPLRRDLATDRSFHEDDPSPLGVMPTAKPGESA